MRRLVAAVFVGGLLLASTSAWQTAGVHAASEPKTKQEFRTSDRCVACHNGLKTSKGEDVSIGFQWRASAMANSARDPYWQGSVRRETIDHPEHSAEVEDECSTCHMPMQHLIQREAGKKTQVFAHLPLSAHHPGNEQAADGVSCSVCHQVESNGLGTERTFNGNVEVAKGADAKNRPEYGPFEVDAAHQKIMQSSTKGLVPQQAAHIRDSGLCGSCHTLYTTARGAGGKAVGRLPEQMPYLEWLHSDYSGRESCQSCHMPRVDEPMRITAVYGPLREGMHRHVFVGGNFLLESMLSNHRDELDVKATPEELAEANKRTTEFVQTKSAKVSLESVEEAGGKVSFAVKVENLTGHKLPTAYPSRRVWLHVTVRDAGGRMVFESGALRPDGSIVGNANDEDPKKFEPHYPVITQPDQVEIFEPILHDENGQVTTGLLAAVGYAKDNRLLPYGFDKTTASHDIAVVGDAAKDPGFTDKGALIRYDVRTGAANGPMRVEAELWYEPVGYRWAHNFEPYSAAEPQRFLNYYKQEAEHAATVLAKAQAVASH